MTNLYRTINPLPAVRLPPQSRGRLSTLPIGARLRVTGQSSLPGFIDVVYKDKLYCVFQIDLVARSMPSRTLAAAA
jgi:hypothetical protein